MTLRGDTYRRKLGHLSDEAWLHAVEAALEEPGGWFPGIGDLLDHAARAPQQPSRADRALVDDTRTLDERRADARRLLDLIEAEVREREKALPPTPVASLPPEETVIVLDQHPERLDELRRQAREITEANPDDMELLDLAEEPEPKEHANAIGGRS